MLEIYSSSHQLEAGNPTDPEYMKAMELLNSRSVPRSKVERYWFDELLTIGQCPEERWSAILERVRSANEMLPIVTSLIYRDILLKRKSGQTTVELDRYLLSEDYPKNLGVSRREYQIAASHVIFQIYAEDLRNCQELEEEKHFGPLKYFGAIHDLLVGVQTGKSYFVALAYQGELDFRLIENINIPVVFADDEEVFSAQMKVLLEGGGATPLKKVGDATYSILSFEPDTKKEEK